MNAINEFYQKHKNITYDSETEDEDEDEAETENEYEAETEDDDYDAMSVEKSKNNSTVSWKLACKTGDLHALSYWFSTKFNSCHDEETYQKKL